MNDNAKPDQLGRLAYSVAEAAQVIGLGKTTLYALMDAGKLPFVHIGTRRRIRAADLNALLAGRAANAT